MNGFAGKTVLVTGGSRGLGREVVRAFAARGADVVIASRKLDACVALAEEVRAAHGVAALPVACNVSHWAECDALVERVGRVDVLVNNAGLSPTYPSVDAVSEELFDKVVGVNLKGPFRLAAAFGTRMAEAGGGAIVNVTSMEAERPRSWALPYAAAKAGLNALTVGLAHTFGPTVRVNAVQAGPFLTDIATAWPPAVRAAIEQELALGRCGRPEEVVGAVLHLASADASFTTGAILKVDGGAR